MKRTFLWLMAPVPISRAVLLIWLGAVAWLVVDYIA